MLNPVSFKGTYKINYGAKKYNKDKCGNYSAAQEYLRMLAGGHRGYEHIPKAGDPVEVGVTSTNAFFAGLYSIYVIPDEQNSMAECYLDSLGVPFKKVSNAELFDAVNSSAN